MSTKGSTFSGLSNPSGRPSVDRQMEQHFNTWLREEAISRLGGIDAARARFEVESGSEIRQALETEERAKENAYEAQRKAALEVMSKVYAPPSKTQDYWQKEIEKQLADSYYWDWGRRGKK